MRGAYIMGCIPALAYREPLTRPNGLGVQQLESIKGFWDLAAEVEQKFPAFIPTVARFAS